MDKIWSEVKNDRVAREPYRIRVPFLAAGKEIGLGEVIKRTTSRLGIQPCDSCNRRARRLDGLALITGSESDLAHGQSDPWGGDLQRWTTSTKPTRLKVKDKPDRISLPAVTSGRGGQEKQDRSFAKSRNVTNREARLLKNTLNRRDFVKLSAGVAGLTLLGPLGRTSDVSAQVLDVDECLRFQGRCTGFWGGRQCIAGPVEPFPDAEVIVQCCNGWNQYPWIEACSGQPPRTGCGFCLW
jgi:hypothetical protein